MVRPAVAAATALVLVMCGPCGSALAWQVKAKTLLA